MQHARRRLPIVLTACAVVAGGIAAGAAMGSASASSVPSGTPALQAAWYASAPYVMPEDSNPPDLAQVMAATGQKAYELAFVLADGGSCAPAWDGTAPVAGDTAVAGTVSALRAAGGDVSVSFGGYNGTKLGQVCSSASATAAAYQQVVTAYGLHAVDFDLEEPEYENAGAIANELGAAQILQRDNPGLYVSVTLPGTAAGTGWFGSQLLDEAKTLGFTPATYAIMPFDGGFDGAASQVSALDAFHGLLMSTFGWDSATAYAHEGFSGMNGRSDSGEYFSQSDFQTVLDYAESHHLGRFTFWSLNRDRPCTPVDDNGTTSATCSSVAQNPWDFTRFTTGFAEAAGAGPAAAQSPSGPSSPAPPPAATPAPSASSAPGTVPPTTAAPAPAAGGGCTAAAWTTGTAYVAGDVVSYAGERWTAKWWNYNEAPGGGSEAWTQTGGC